MCAQTYLIHARGIYDSERRAIADADGMLIRDGRIEAISSFEWLLAQMPGVRQLDLSDCYLFPGLINTHVHLEFDASAEARLHYLEGSEGGRILLAAEHAKQLLRSGVTTVRDAGSSWRALDLLDEQVSRSICLPRMQLAGPPLTVTGGHLHFLGEETDGVTDMVRQTRIRQKRGCGAVKLIVTGGQMTPGSVAERVSMTVGEIRAVTREAHSLGLRTFAHCLTTEGFVRCMEGGVDCIEHIACFKRNEGNRLLERVYEPERMEPYRGAKRDFMMGLSAGYHNLDAYRDAERACGANEAFWLEQEERMFSIFRRCVALGLRPVCGTDAGTGGTRFDETWLELALMVERGGFTPAQAIAAGTESAAACLGLEKVTGRLREGYDADVIALRENPLERIRALGCVRQVISRGTIVL